MYHTVAGILQQCDDTINDNTTGGFPYPTIQNEEFLPLLKKGYRMEKPDNCSSEVYVKIIIEANVVVNFSYTLRIL